jgi:hypothetical protein
MLMGVLYQQCLVVLLMQTICLLSVDIYSRFIMEIENQLPMSGFRIGLIYVERNWGMGVPEWKRWK